jgi:hypothetical protein
MPHSVPFYPSSGENSLNFVPQQRHVIKNVQYARIDADIQENECLRNKLNVVGDRETADAFIANCMSLMGYGLMKDRLLELNKRHFHENASLFSFSSNYQEYLWDVCWKVSPASKWTWRERDSIRVKDRLDECWRVGKDFLDLYDKNNILKSPGINIVPIYEAYDPAMSFMAHAAHTNKSGQEHDIKFIFMLSH